MRFIHSMRLLDISLNTHINNFSNKIYNQHCKHFLKCKDCKECKGCKDDAVESSKKM